MKTRKSNTLFVVSFLLLTPALFAGDLTNPFYAMDTNVWSWQDRTPPQVATMLKDLGYDGYGHGGTKDIPPYIDAMKTKDMKVFNTYVGMNLDAKQKYDPAVRETIKQFKGTGAMLWLFVQSGKYKRTTQDGDEVAVQALTELADFAHQYDVKIALYPHTSFYVENVSDAVRIAHKVNRRNLGVTFNLCHWLKVDGPQNMKPLIESALPYLFQVTINGADDGNTKQMNWDRLIQPLGSGSYDVHSFVKTLHELGYKGPIGLQGYGIKGDPKQNLKTSIAAWENIKSEINAQ